VVIGETTEIGEGVKLYSGVTLGALSFPRDAAGQIIRGKKRHPTVESGSTLYAKRHRSRWSDGGRCGQRDRRFRLSTRSVPPRSRVSLKEAGIARGHPRWRGGTRRHLF